jgi:hypothetical protein
LLAGNRSQSLEIGTDHRDINMPAIQGDGNLRAGEGRLQ